MDIFNRIFNKENIFLNNSFKVVKYIGLFGFGSAMLRSAGCAINDLWDREFDKNVTKNSLFKFILLNKKVERTKLRPLASGELTEKQAFKFIFLHLLAKHSNNWPKFCYYANCYFLPFGKKIYKLSSICFRFSFDYYIFILLSINLLGMAFNWGIVTGYTAITGILDYNVVIPAYIGKKF